MQNQLEKNIETILDSRSSHRLQRLFQSRGGLWLVAAISFFESALPVPIITDPFMVAAILANRQKTVAIIVVTSVSSVIGGLAAFTMAWYFFDLLFALLPAATQTEFAAYAQFDPSEAFVMSILGAVTPVPYTLSAWVVAVAKGSVWAFLLASVIGRTGRYVVVGYCTYVFGPLALQYAKRYMLATTVIVFLLVGLYVWYKFFLH